MEVLNIEVSFIWRSFIMVSLVVMTFGLCRARVTLGGCVKVSDEYAEVFSKLMLLFSITNAWMTSRGDEDADFSQIM